jgi:hypothetical protein
MWYTTGNLVVNFVEVFIFAPADKTYRYKHRHRQVSTVTQSLKKALSVGLNQVSALPTLQPKYGNRTICRKVVFFSMYKSCVVFYTQGNKQKSRNLLILSVLIQG